jgi:hypothetical protein
VAPPAAGRGGSSNNSRAPNIRARSHGGAAKSALSALMDLRTRSRRSPRDGGAAQGPAPSSPSVSGSLPVDAAALTAAHTQAERHDHWEETMLCYPCATRGVERPAVGICRSCSAGLCLEHLREAAGSLAPNSLSGCRHDTWACPADLSTGDGRPITDLLHIRCIGSSRLGNERRHVEARVTV